jgi:hypothetical protein
MGIGMRQANMAWRTNAGLRDGSLTGAEGDHLRTRLQGIRGAIKVGKADGQLSAPERQEIRKQQRALSRDIWEARHNDEGINNSNRPRPCGCPTSGAPTSGSPTPSAPTAGSPTPSAPTPSAPTAGSPQSPQGSSNPSMNLQQLVLSLNVLINQKIG